MKLKIKLNFLLFSTFFVSYVIYPVWYIPIPLTLRLLLFNVFLILSFLILISNLKKYEIQFRLDKKSIFESICILLPVIMLHIPFWILPIPTGGDDQSHAGPAATFIGKISQGIPQPFLNIVTILLIVVVIWFLKNRKIQFAKIDYKKLFLGLLLISNLFFSSLTDLNY